jgi:ATP-dependent RNA helicase DHX37/DHR1
MDVEEEEESILSPELRAQLGSSEVIVGKRKKKAAAPKEEVEEEVVLSKSQKRKLESIKKRKENEAKRAHYLCEIDKHKLSADHQQLMVSARDQGQKHTQKWRLQMIIRRHQAGLHLRDEERALLVPYLDAQLVESDPEDEEADQASKKRRKDARAMAEAVGALSDPLAPAPAQTSGLVEMPLSAPVGQDTATLLPLPLPLVPEAEAEASDGLTLGERLMAQFNQIKTKSDSDNDAAAAARARAEGDGFDKYGALSGAFARPAYVQGPEVSAMDNLAALHQGASAGAGPGAGARAGGDSASISTRRWYVNRTDAIQLSRMQLPVCGMEQEIVEAIGCSDCVILCGETGSGKSTQVPQFLYEAGYCSQPGVMVGITQPRRVAASSTAMRVAVEMNCPIGGPPAAADATADDAPAPTTDSAGNDLSAGAARRAKKKSNKLRRAAAGAAQSKQLVGFQVRI